MTKNKTKKRAVRARMKKTGESYQAALRSTLASPAPRQFFLHFDDEYHLVGAESVLIGRSPSAAIRITDGQASLRHATVAASDGALRLTDLGSLNGTHVNGKRITEVELQYGDRIIIGATSITIVAERATSGTMLTAPAAIPRARFFIRHGQTYAEVGAQPVTVGRLRESTFRLEEDLGISKRHASFVLDEGRLVVRDENSMNGVWINSVRVRGEQELHYGDVVAISRARFVVEREAITPVAPIQLASAPTPAVGTVIAGRYRLDRIVAPPKGLLAGEPAASPWILFDAEHVVLGAEVSIKLLPKAATVNREYLRVWLLREGRALQRAAHPGVAKVLDIGETESGAVYLVLERLPEKTLDTCVPEGGLSDAAALEYFRPLLDAVAHVHERGVIHRGLRCGAVCVSDKGLVLTSFALATIEGEPRLTPIGATIGHPSWSSPEQRAGEEVDVRSDLYSLGVMLYALATGRLPPSDTLPPPIRDASSPLDPVLRRLLAPHAAERYESAAALKNALV